MKFENMSDLPRSMQRLLVQQIPFALRKENERFLISRVGEVSFDECGKSIHVFAQELRKELEIIHLPNLEKKHRDFMQEVADFLEVFAPVYRKKGGSAEIGEQLSDLSRAIGWGAKVDPAKLDEESRKFLEVNQFHKKTLPLQLMLKQKWDEGFVVPCEIESGIYHHVPFKKLDKVEIEDKRGKKQGWNFKLGDNTLFQTDFNFKLTERYTILHDGITQHHPIKSFTLHRAYKRDPATNNHKNQIAYLVRGKSVDLELRREDGSVYSIGMDRKYIASPSLYFLDPVDAFFVHVIDKEKFKSVRSSIEKEKFYPGLVEKHKNVFFVVDDLLKLDLAPKKPLVTRNRALAYLTLPYLALRYIYLRRKHQLPPLKDMLKAPHSPVILDEAKLIKQIRERGA